jgi:hypothetical protein
MSTLSNSIISALSSLLVCAVGSLGEPAFPKGTFPFFLFYFLFFGIFMLMDIARDIKNLKPKG